MAEYYRGKRVSTYRKEYWCSGGIFTAGGGSLIMTFPDITGYIRKIKNIRGLFVIGPTSPAGASGTTNLHGQGWVGLQRYPRAETLSGPDVQLDASSLLHPVPFTYLTYPVTIPYTFRGITLGQEEKMYIVTHMGCLGLHSGGSATVVGSLLWDEERQYVT